MDCGLLPGARPNFRPGRRESRAAGGRYRHNATHPKNGLELPGLSGLRQGGAHEDPRRGDRQCARAHGAPGSDHGNGRGHGAITVPVVILQGDSDASIRHDIQAARRAAALPNAELRLKKAWVRCCTIFCKTICGRQSKASPRRRGRRQRVIDRPQQASNGDGEMGTGRKLPAAGGSLAALGAAGYWGGLRGLLHPDAAGRRVQPHG